MTELRDERNLIRVGAMDGWAGRGLCCEAPRRRLERPGVRRRNDAKCHRERERNERSGMFLICKVQRPAAGIAAGSGRFA